MSVIKITGAQTIANATFGNSTVGNTCSNATSLYIFNTGTGVSAITLATGTSNTTAVGVNVGSISITSNSYIILRKYPYDQVFVANNSNTMYFTPIAAGAD